jgi:hypothetical protein
VYRHGIGVPTDTLEQIVHEWGGHSHGPGQMDDIHLKH